MREADNKCGKRTTNAGSEQQMRKENENNLILSTCYFKLLKNVRKSEQKRTEQGQRSNKIHIPQLAYTEGVLSGNRYVQTFTNRKYRGDQSRGRVYRFTLGLAIRI